MYFALEKDTAYGDVNAPGMLMAFQSRKERRTWIRMARWGEERSIIDKETVQATRTAERIQFSIDCA